MTSVLMRIKAMEAKMKLVDDDGMVCMSCVMLSSLGSNEKVERSGGNYLCTVP